MAYLIKFEHMENPRGMSRRETHAIWFLLVPTSSIGVGL
jgi:hypothetical protein